MCIDIKRYQTDIISKQVKRVPVYPVVLGDDNDPAGLYEDAGSSEAPTTERISSVTPLTTQIPPQVTPRPRPSKNLRRRRDQI